jgi:hypothetical protein
MRSLRWSFAAVACALLGATPACGVDLTGTWHVLVHYTDAGSGSPEQPRWEDEVWVFEQRDGRLRWTAYPIAVFEDETGRFELDPAGRYARIPHFWQPNAAQRADIADGLRVNARGAKRKTLRGSPAEGWSSAPAGAAPSVSVLTYAEVWRIDGPTERPVFSRADSLSGAGVDGLEGLARYATRAVREGGDLLEGSFERDDTRSGTFRLLRCGEAEVLRKPDGRARRGQQPAAAGEVLP